jgi:hypothetical protein
MNIPHPDSLAGIELDLQIRKRIEDRLNDEDYAKTPHPEELAEIRVVLKSGHVLRDTVHRIEITKYQRAMRHYWGSLQCSDKYLQTEGTTPVTALWTEVAAIVPSDVPLAFATD